MDRKLKIQAQCTALKKCSLSEKDEWLTMLIESQLGPGWEGALLAALSQLVVKYQVVDIKYPRG